MTGSCNPCSGVSPTRTGGPQPPSWAKRCNFDTVDLVTGPAKKPRPSKPTACAAALPRPDARCHPDRSAAFVDDTEAGAVHLAPEHPVSTPPTVEGMPGGALPMGRIPVSDVRPLVDGGTRPAKSVVGEEFAVRAKVFREGHDAVNATAVLTDPDGDRATTSRCTRQPGPLRVVDDRRRRPRGLVDLPRRGLVRPLRDLGARRRHQDRGRGRRGAHVRRGRPRARALRRGRARPGRRRRPRSTRASSRSATPGPRRAPLRRGDLARDPGLAALVPLREFVSPHRHTPCSSSASARSTAPGTRSSPGPRARTATRRRRRGCPARSGPRPSGCPRSPTWASTSST